MSILQEKDSDRHRKIAADLIPVNWPTEHYQKQTPEDHTLAFGRLTKPINLGLSTIFATLGIAIAVG